MSNTHSSIRPINPYLPLGLWVSIATALQRLAAAARRLREDRRHERQVRDTHLALQELDTRTLLDLGIHRSEIASLAREVHGHRPWTRDRERARSREAARGLYL